MGVPGNANALLLRSAAVAGGYQVSRSLRFNSSDSAYASRVFSSAGNRKTFTYSCWVKRNKPGAFGRLFSAGTGTTDATFFQLTFRSSDILAVEGTGTSWRLTTQVFRDPSAWMHIVLVIDTSLATAADRIKLYANGSQITTFSTSNNPTQNYDFVVNNNVEHMIGADKYNNAYSYYSDFQIADCHFIDGQALDPTSFGEFDTNNIWQPKAYSGSYGTNGFQLKFADNSAATAAALGKDTSGNGNNWTPNNLSVTAGAGNDSLVDSPTNYGTDSGAGGEVRGNYCTMNPLDAASGAALTLANGNLEHTNPSTNWRWRRGTFAMTTGKWYWEQTVSDGATASTGYLAGVATSSFDFNVGTAGLYARQSSTQYNNGSSSTPFSTTTAGDVLGFAFDADAGKLWVSKNGTFDGNPVAGTGNSWSSVPTGVFPLFGAYNVSGNIMNFGQRPFAYTAPSGFKALCTTNLPTPTIANGATAMDVKLYTGNGSTQTISGLNFSPDLVYVKARSASGTSPVMFDTVRGTSKRLRTNATDAELDPGLYGNVSAFNSDGFTVAAYSGDATEVNASSTTYVAWTWDAGSSTVTNTQGSITSQVRANASAGFSIVTYTGTGSNATVGHGLGVAPGMVIVKRRNSTSNWQVRHTSMHVANGIQLNLTNAAASATTVWNSTAPTSTVFSIGTDASVNASGGTYVAYCFAPVAGYSSFGSYTGNGSADGPFVFTGMRPRWVMFKSSSNAYYWVINDAARDSFNASNKELFPNDSLGETVVPRDIDFLSNGFKLRNTGATNNQSGATYIYAAFAESPFAYARAR